MWRAFRSEWIKIRRISVLLAAAAMIGFTVLGVFFAITRAKHRADSAAFVASLSSTHGLVTLLTRGSDLIAVIALIVVTATTGSEWSQGTLRNLLVAQPGRLRLLAGKFLAMLVYVLVSALVALAVGVVLAFAISPSSGIATSAWTSSDGITALQEFFGNVALAIIGWSVFGLLIAVLIRSAAAAVGVSIAYLIVIEALISSVLPDVAKWLPGHLLEDVLLGQNGGGDVAYTTALLLSGAYVAAMLIISGLSFRLRDVTA